jgi:hypothetical protein
VTAYCLEPHDLWISKAIANRPKDIEFCDALVERAIVDPATLGSRLSTTKGLDEAVERPVRERIERAWS